ncbi:hypothetical protein CTEN210_10246 [Chaetoceros tenuissimus]|uniref:RRM domain-containing protein n=1 Tax=Chaetoceros tenuissimus TaxID=426638 RepID=A0AAD3CZH3_9STRA|nr:hypothetical protein CTEN210_10246 [Chaetoceros tenuissimus]
MSEEEDPQHLAETKSAEKKKKKKSKKKSKKSKKSKKEVETADSPTDAQDETIKESKPQEKSNDDESDDDSDLEGLASMWAETKEYEEKKKLADSNFEKLKDEFKKQKTPKSKPQLKQPTKQTKASMHTPYNPNGIFTKTKEEQNAKYSLHITNLPYHVQKHDIEEAFKNKGCDIISTRLVYNYHVSRRTYKDERRGDKQVTNENGFTGVAFIDVRDEKSYKLALSMDKTVLGDDDNEEKGKGRGWRRRKMNVRPTKTQKELADIVKNTKQKVQEQKEEYNKMKSEGVKKNESDKNETPKKKRKVDEDGEGMNSSVKKKRRSKKDGDKKLTKKERARKAAILRQKK